MPNVAGARRARRRGGDGLQQPAGDVARLGQQEQADLRDVRAGRDVDEVVLVVGVERIGAREVVQAAVDLLEVPRIVAGSDRRRGAPSVSGETRRMSSRTVSASAVNSRRVQQLEAIDEQVLVLAERDRRAPVLPALAAACPRRASCRAGR